MAALTAASQNVHSLGDKTLYQFRFSAGDANDTFATGLGDRIISFWSQHRANPSTQTSVGVGITNSSGTLTFTPAVDGDAFDIFVIATGV